MSDFRSEPLHKVTEEELPILFDWTAKHLPKTYKIHNTIEAELKGLWPGPTYYTLGWPNILAVGEGPVDPSKSKCSTFFNHTRHTCVYAPNLEHLEQLLLRPEFLDWTKPILFHGVWHECAELVWRISNETGTKFNKIVPTIIMMANPGDVAARPAPEGFEIRSLDPDLDVAYVTSTWPYRRLHTEEYLREVLKRFPSVGIFDRDGNCVAVQVGTEFGFAALLHVREELRGRGLAPCVVSQMAQKYFQENKPIISTVTPENTASMRVYEKLGFKGGFGVLTWLVHSMTSEKVLHNQ